MTISQCLAKYFCCCCSKKPTVTATSLNAVRPRQAVHEVAMQSINTIASIEIKEEISNHHSEAVIRDPEITIDGRIVWT